MNDKLLDFCVKNIFWIIICVAAVIASLVSSDSTSTQTYRDVKQLRQERHSYEDTQKRQRDYINLSTGGK